MTKSTALATRPAAKPISVFANPESFEVGQRMCKALCNSDLVPTSYRGEGAMGNALIALDMANRMNIPPIMVMQNLDIIEGRPSWKSQFILGALNSCGMFSPVRFRIEDRGEQEAEKVEWAGPRGNRSKTIKKTKIREKTCVAYAIEKATGETLEGPEVSISMAVAEGWYFRPGSKWQTMPDLMLRYRSAAFFGRLYAPHILNGMPSTDEAIDVPVVDDFDGTTLDAETGEITEPAPAKPAGRASKVHAAMNAKSAPAKHDEPPAAKADDVTDIEPDDVTDIEPDDVTDIEPDEGPADSEPDDVPFGDPEEDDDGYSPA
ncbi:hypothetical protein [Breoghania sp.]|uniref:hypothetical protein n=1 Tax=Breoghania sp. TaxID=2065378 RepID=UPI002AA5EA5D|nr:hypothetical protein [Breoghania sp.]